MARPRPRARLAIHVGALRQAVRVHENGHRDLALEAGATILGQLSALRTRDCVEMAELARGTARAVVTRHQRLNELDERQTRMGATQGAVSAAPGR